MRGQADFHSIATSKKILSEGRQKLLVFPEAEITADEKRLHSLHNAIFHIALSVQKELSESDTGAQDHPVLIIPAAIKFSLDCDLESALGPTLEKMEKRLAIQAQAHKDALSRVKAVVDSYLRLLFDTYGIEKAETTLDKMPALAAVEILNKIAAREGVATHDSLSTSDRLYNMRNELSESGKLNSVAITPQTFYCAGIPKPCISSDFERIERLLILQRMLEHSSSAVQCCRILDFIECELFDKISPKGMQSCKLLLGTAIELSEFVEQYDESKEDGVNRLSERFMQQMQSMLANKEYPDAVQVQ